MMLAHRIATRSSTVRRVVAVLTLILLGSVAWEGVLKPIRTMTVSQDAWRAQARAELAQNRGRVAIETAVREQLEALPKALIWNRFYGPAGDANLASSVQRDVTNLCTSAGGVVESTLLLPNTTESRLARFGVRIIASLSADQLRAFFAGIRGHTPYLRIEHLTVSAPQIQSSDKNAAVRVVLDVYGYSPNAAGKMPSSARQT